jgi:hypothetical protein
MEQNKNEKLSTKEKVLICVGSVGFVVLVGGIGFIAGKRAEGKLLERGLNGLFLADPTFKTHMDQTLKKAQEVLK